MKPVRIDTTEYRAATGDAPRGYGDWSFECGTADGAWLAETYRFNGPYQKARRAAGIHAAANGCTVAFLVAPSPDA